MFIQKKKYIYILFRITYDDNETHIIKKIEDNVSNGTLFELFKIRAKKQLQRFKKINIYIFLYLSCPLT